MVGVDGLGLRVCVALAGCGIGRGDSPVLGPGWGGRADWVVDAGEALLWFVRGVDVYAQKLHFLLRLAS
jgi:hypothetical protein